MILLMGLSVIIATFSTLAEMSVVQRPIYQVCTELNASLNLHQSKAIHGWVKR